MTLDSGQVFHWEKVGQWICRDDWRAAVYAGAACEILRVQSWRQRN